MNKKLNIHQGWLRALIFFFAGIVLSGLVASLLESPIHQGVFGSAFNYGKTLLGICAQYLVNQLGWIICIWFFRTKVDGLSIFSLGFEWRDTDAWLGLGVSITIIGFGTMLLNMGDNFAFRGYHFDGGDVLIALLFFILVAFIEEIIVRGYILSNLMLNMNRWVALLISAAFFSLMHTTNPEITPVAVVNIFLAGIILGVNYIYKRNLWFAIFFHFGWNFVQGTVLGYHVSGISIGSSICKTATSGPDFVTGGEFGFEGSIFAAFLQIIAIAVLTMYYEGAFKKRQAVSRHGH